MKRNYINDELVHWTGRKRSEDEAFRILRSICDEQVLRLPYCPRYAQEGFQPKTAMACFTDVPLRHSKEHCGKFGKFGIGFHKERMISYGANPVFYTTGSHLERMREVYNLTSSLYELYKDRDWREDVEPYQFTDKEFLALHEISEFTQEYSYKNNDSTDYLNYYQREWRLTFNSLKFTSGSDNSIPGEASFYIKDGDSHEIFNFSSDIVSYIIVPWRYYWKARELSKKLNCKLKIYEIAVDT